MYSDSIYRIGSTHSVCEDYALSGVYDKKAAWAIVSDGCSSSQNTDIGSRILSQLGKKYIESACEQTDCRYTNLLDGVDTRYFLMEGAKKMCLALGLPLFSLDATLLSVAANKDKYKVVCWGDGVVITKFSDGMCHIIELESFDSYPSYLSYFLHDKNDLGISKVEQMRNMGMHTEVRFFTMNQDKVVHFERSYILPFLEPYVSDVEVMDTECVLLCSDGIQSFFDTEKNDFNNPTTPVNFMEVVKELVDFKGFKGEFVARRCNKMLKKLRIETGISTMIFQ